MTLVVSTSSPVASYAWFDETGRCLDAAEREARADAGRLLREAVAGCRPSRVVADVGPGGFTGVRVGVTFAKALGWSLGIPVAAISAFDLYDPADGPVALPLRRGRWLFEGVETDAFPLGAQGYGLGVEPRYPAARLVRWDRIVASDPFALAPAYAVEPSVSTPNRPYDRVVR